MDHSTTERQDPDDARQAQLRRRGLWLAVGLAGFILLQFAIGVLRPDWAEPQRAPMYWPDPTPAPIIQRHTEYNFFSKNQFLSGNNVCIGDCE